MRRFSFYRATLLIATIAAVFSIWAYCIKQQALWGPGLIVFLLATAISFRGFSALRAYAYSMMIFAMVAAALTYPQYFVSIEGFPLAALITPLIQLIMFGMGTSMSVQDFVGVIKHPKGVFIGVVSHFIFMPCVGFFLANVSGFSPEIAAGIILIGCSPNGMASNVMSYMAKANLPLSITITAVSTLLSPLVTPMLMKMLAGAFVEIHLLDMMWDILKMVILPIGAGLLFNKLFHGKIKWLDNLMPKMSMAGIAFIIVIITAAGRDSLLHIGPQLILFVLIHNLTGYLLGYSCGRIFRMSERDCRTMAIEVGMQNGGLASGIAKEMGKLATVGLAPAIFGPLMNVTGSLLASYWQHKPLADSNANLKTFAEVKN